MQKLTFKPSAAIAGKYLIVNTCHPIYYSKLGTIDFRTITLVQAAALVEAGSLYIKKKGAKSPIAHK